MKFIEWIQDYKVRRWIYGVATAVLLYLAGQGVITSIQHDNINNIVSSVLNVGLAGVTTLAARKADPVEAAKGTSPVQIVAVPEEPNSVELPETPEPWGILGVPEEFRGKHAE